MSLACVCISILIALGTVALDRLGWLPIDVVLLQMIVEWAGFGGLALCCLSFFAPLLVHIAACACGRDPLAIMADRRRGVAVKFARFLTDRLDRLSIDTAKRAVTAEISNFERRKFTLTLLAGTSAGAGITAVAKSMGPEVAAWVDPITLGGTALASGVSLGLLATLSYVDRLHRILDALNEAEVILEAREEQMKVASRGRSAWLGIMTLLDTRSRRLAQ